MVTHTPFNLIVAYSPPLAHTGWYSYPRTHTYHAHLTPRPPNHIPLPSLPPSHLPTLQLHEPPHSQLVPHRARQEIKPAPAPVRPARTPCAHAGAHHPAVSAQDQLHPLGVGGLAGALTGPVCVWQGVGAGRVRGRQAGWGGTGWGAVVAAAHRNVPMERLPQYDPDGVCVRGCLEVYDMCAEVYGMCVC